VRLGFVCTNYNNSSFTRAAVASLHSAGRGGDVRVVVVDNRSRDEEVAALEAVAREFPGVDVVRNPENSGYFPGLNLGMRRLRDTCPDIEHLVIGNNDLEFPPDFVPSVERHREVLDEWAVVAPDIVTPAGVHQNPHVLHPIGRVRRLVWDVYFSSFAAATAVKGAVRVLRGAASREENDPSSGLWRTAATVEQGYGACYLVGPAFFRHFTGLYAPTFMLQEEFFLGEQLKLVGQGFRYDPRFVVVHHGHAATDRLPGRRQWAMGRDAHRIYKEFLGLSPGEQRRRIAERVLRPPPEPLGRGAPPVLDRGPAGSHRDA
jgi:GT2 family glycosyltransferase